MMRSQAKVEGASQRAHDGQHGAARRNTGSFALVVVESIEPLDRKR